MVGDWGGLPYPPYTTAVQKATARAMAAVAEQRGADFVLALGDNFYYTGVESVDSPRFQVGPVCVSLPLTPLFSLERGSEAFGGCHRWQQCSHSVPNRNDKNTVVKVKVLIPPFFTQVES